MTDPEGKPKLVEVSKPTTSRGRSFARLLMRDQRLRVLELLAMAPGRACNADVLQSGLELWGHRASFDRILSLSAWLGEQGLAEVTGESPRVVMRLTRRGLDVAEGRARASGVPRPSPGP